MATRPQLVIMVPPAQHICCCHCQAEVEQMRVRLREASTLHDRHHREQLVATTIEATSLVLSLGISNPTAMYHKAFISMADGSAVQHQTPENSLTLLVCFTTA